MFGKLISTIFVANKKNMEKDDYMKTLTAPKMEYDNLLGGVVPKKKCAVKTKTGKHCPETGLHHIDDTHDFLCDRCFDNWKHIHNNPD